MGFFSELKQRKVYQVAAIYAAVAWGLLQVADIVFPSLGLPDWSITFLFALEVVGFPLALILSWIFDLTRDGVVRTGRGAVGAARALKARESLAVLPFSNMSDDPSLDHLADGLVEDLITRLHGNVGIPVNSRNSCFVYKGQAVDVVKVAEELGAAFIVEGSVRVQGDTARVTAQLIDAASDHHIWAEKYDRPIGDIFSLQDELVEAMAAAIMERLPAKAAAEHAPAPVDAASKPVGFKKRWVVLTAIVMLGLAGVLTWTLELRSQERWVREVALPEIEKLIEADDAFGAFARIKEVAAILPSDPLLLKYRDEVSEPATIMTEPPGVHVSYKAYGAPDSEWRSLGTSPLEDVSLPVGYLQLKFEGNGLLSAQRLVRNPASLLNNFDLSPVVADISPEGVVYLAEAVVGREDSVYVPYWDMDIALPDSAIPAAERVPAFFIDRHEVTNARYQEFVDSGGYSNPKYWDTLDSGRTDWAETVAAFTDQTGQPGPAGWEMGRYRPGDDDLPVTGVSWFEAAAYAKFRGKELPTLYHWYLAALDPMEIIAPLAPAIIRESNFAGAGLAPAGQYPGVSYYGAHDMGGNAREWLANADGDLMWVAGGAWNEVPYMFFSGDYVSPWDRGPTNGFRCMVNADGRATPAVLAAATDTRGGFSPQMLTPVDDETYAIYRDQFGYLKQDLQPKILSSEQKAFWREEKVHINSPYSDAGMDLLLMVPESGVAPFQAIVVMPGSDVFFPGASLDGYNWNDYEPSIGAMLRSGRAVVLPVWEGTFGRGMKRPQGGEEERREWWRTRVFRWRQDLGTTLDYLQSRDDFNGDRFGYLGISAGSSLPIAALAVESRLKTVILIAGGLSLLNEHPSIQPKNHAPRLSVPVMMMNGRYDQAISMEDRQVPLFELLGSGPGRKKHVVYDAGHVGYPVSRQRREIIDWLDTWLGPVR